MSVHCVPRKNIACSEVEERLTECNKAEASRALRVLVDHDLSLQEDVVNTIQGERLPTEVVYLDVTKNGFFDEKLSPRTLRTSQTPPSSQRY